MKFRILLLLLFCSFFIKAYSQTAITAINTSSSATPGSFSYSNAGINYNWGLSPNNTRVFVDGFTAGGVGYSYASFLTGNVRLRRVNNAGTSGNFTLVWAEAVTAGTTYNMFPEYQNDMEPFFNNRIYNKGTDNFFDNTSSNSNNIERMDWILNAAWSTSTPAQVGFAVFERGAVGAHDPFCIAAITSLDGFGNPASYSNIVRVTTANYGDPGPNVTYRILKAQNPLNLLDAGTNTQSRGGLIISLQSLGITPGQNIYGYSLFSNDLPVGATPANLVDYTNTTYFPTNTGNPGGLDLVAVTGVYIENSVLPVKFTGFNAIENQDIVTLKWSVENETTGNLYEVERSTDGRVYSPITSIQPLINPGGTNSYTYLDNIASLISNQIFYRIKQYDADGSYYFSKTIVIKRNQKHDGMAIYPNPAKDNLQINISSYLNEQVLLSVTNSGGVQLINKKLNLLTGNNSISVNEISNLPAGSYLLSMKWVNGKIISRQFLKQ